MPTMFMSGPSAAPIENSPPGIHTMPGGGEPGAVLAFSIVGPDGDAEADVDGRSGPGCVHAHRLKAAAHERTRERMGDFIFNTRARGLPIQLPFQPRLVS